MIVLKERARLALRAIIKQCGFLLILRISASQDQFVSLKSHKSNRINDCSGWNIYKTDFLVRTSHLRHDITSFFYFKSTLVSGVMLGILILASSVFTWVVALLFLL